MCVKSSRSAYHVPHLVFYAAQDARQGQAFLVFRRVLAVDEALLECPEKGVNDDPPHIDVKRSLLEVSSSRGRLRFSGSGMGEGGVNAVSYTHLTLPTICSV